MIYTVQVKRNYSEYKDYTTIDAYFQGSERQFNTEEEAVQYFKSFEDWEQDLLMIDCFPFWLVLGGASQIMAVISLLIRNQASLVVQTHQRLLPPAEMGTAQQE